MFYKCPTFSVLFAAISLLLLSGCNDSKPIDDLAQTVSVSVLTLKAQDRLQTQDFPGRVAAVRVAEIRAQVTGIVQTRLFEQGVDITAGSVLFQINAAPFQAEVDSAVAAFNKAQAVAKRTGLEVKRLGTLSARGVISRQLYDDAMSLHEQALADVDLAKATLKRRKLDLQFAKVTAPITGRIDQTLVSEGGLVSPTDAMPMAKIQQIDQVYVDVRVPATLVAALQQLAKTPTVVDIVDSNGVVLNSQGRVMFTGSEVDSGTGDVLVRVLVDNSTRQLLPGMYVQARLPLASFQDTIFIPQQAVSRVQGQPTVWLMNTKQQVAAVPIAIAELIDGHYRVTSGLSAGQQLVVEGIEKLAPSAQVIPQPWLSASSHVHSPLATSAAE